MAKGRAGKRRGQRRRAWSAEKYWRALRAPDKARLAATLGCSTVNVHAQVRKFRASAPGGTETRVVADREIHQVMAQMLDGARFEVLAAVAFVSAAPPPVFEHLLAAAGRGVDVRLLFRADNLAGPLVAPLQAAGVAFRTMPDLHAKLLITDTTAISGSANLTEASATRAAEVGVFLSEPALVFGLREVFLDYWKRGRAY